MIKIVGDINFTDGFFDTGFGIGTSVKNGEDNFPILIDKSNVPSNYRFQHLNSRLKIENENELYYKEVNKCVRNNRLSNYKSFIKSIFKFKLLDMCSIIFDLIKRRVFK